MKNHGMRQFSIVALVLCSLLLGCGSDQTPSTVGWAVGKMPDQTTTAVLKTTDGISWTRITSDKFHVGGGSSVSAIDEQCAWISINGKDEQTVGQVLRTLDGGTTWDDVTPTDIAGNAVNLKAVSRDVAWVGTSSGFLASTDDAGRNWNRITPKNLPANSRYTHIDALDARRAWAVGTVIIDTIHSETLVVRTLDGVNWETMPVIPDELGVLGLSVSPTGRVIIGVQGSGNFYASDDGGTTWRGPVTLLTGDLNDVASYGNIVWGVSDYGVFYLSMNDGLAFTNKHLPGKYDGMWVMGISALNDKKIWVGGSPHGSTLGGLLWTDDGGLTWHEPTPSLYGYDFNRSGISFVGGVK